MYEIYQPTPAEIDSVISRGKAKHPAAAAYYDRAAMILYGEQMSEAGSGRWEVESYDNPGRFYLIDGSPLRCTCPHWQNGGIQIGGKRFCKHTIAVHAYHEILCEQLKTRLASTNTDYATRRRLQLAPGLLTFYSFQPARVGHYANYGDGIPTVVCAVRHEPKRNRLEPADANEYQRFAVWLATVPPVATPADEKFERFCAEWDAHSDWIEAMRDVTI